MHRAQDRYLLPQTYLPPSTYLPPALHYITAYVSQISVKSAASLVTVRGAQTLAKSTWLCGVWSINWSSMYFLPLSFHSWLSLWLATSTLACGKGQHLQVFTSFGRYTQGTKHCHVSQTQICTWCHRYHWETCRRGQR